MQRVPVGSPDLVREPMGFCTEKRSSSRARRANTERTQRTATGVERGAS